MSLRRPGRPRTRNQQAKALHDKTASAPEKLIAISDVRMEIKCLLVLKLVDPRFSDVMEPLARLHTRRRMLSKSRAFRLVAELNRKEVFWAYRAPHKDVVAKLLDKRFLHSKAPWTTLRDYFDGFIGAPATYRGIQSAVDKKMATGMPYIDACREVGHEGISLRQKAPKVYMTQTRVQTFYRKAKTNLSI